MARLAFKKIKAMQAMLAEQRQAADANAQAKAGLEQTIAGLEEAAHTRDAAVAAAEGRVAEVGAGCSGRQHAGHAIPWRTPTDLPAHRPCPAGRGGCRTDAG